MQVWSRCMKFPGMCVICLPMGRFCTFTAASVAPLRSSAPLEEINATRLQSTYLLCVSPLEWGATMTLPMVMADDLPLVCLYVERPNTDLALANLSADLVKSYRASIK